MIDLLDPYEGETRDEARRLGRGVIQSFFDSNENKERMG